MRYRHHKYTWSKPFSSVRHQWEFVGPDGGMHFHASEYDGQWSCGLEIHYANKRGDDAPSQIRCWLLHARCWHDGTSLYAEESLWPLIQPYLKDGEHDKIFRILEREANDRFGYRNTEQA